MTTWLPTDLAPLAFQLVSVVRDYDQAEWDEVLSRVPADRQRELAVLLAAMVDPDQRPSQLLAWTELGPVPSRTDSGRRGENCAVCGRFMAASSIGRHISRFHPDAAEGAA